jgi:hypothetical protein
MFEAVPADILRDLPIVKDWADVAAAAAKNSELRGRVNDQVAKLWTAKTLKDKSELRRWALSGRTEFETVLDMIHGASLAPYDMAADPLGEIFWRGLAAKLGEMEPFSIKAPPRLDVDGVAGIVEQVIEQFRFLIEARRYSEELYHVGRPRPEKAVLT